MDGFVLWIARDWVPDVILRRQVGGYHVGRVEWTIPAALSSCKEISLVARSLSSQKAMRRSKRRTARNLARRTRIKSVIRKVTDAITARDTDTAEKAYREAARVLDRNADHLTLHPNTAARRKSRLAKRINAIKTAARK